MRKLSLIIMATFYFFSGINHFIRPESYKKMIPAYFSFHSLINYASGIAEIMLAILLLIPQTRRFAATAIIIMLILFLPVHIQMLTTGWCPLNKCVPMWIIWVRLLVLQPLLIWWAWKIRASARKIIL